MKKRRMMQITEDTETFRYIYEGKNSTNKTKWAIVEDLVKSIPKSKQDRAFKAFCTFEEELDLLYPGSKEPLLSLWKLILRRIMKVPDSGDGKEVYLEDSYYDDLKKL